MKVRCEYCGIKQIDEAGYCVKCGAPLPEAVDLDIPKPINATGSYPSGSNNNYFGSLAGKISHSVGSNVMIGRSAGYNVTGD